MIRAAAAAVLMSLAACASPPEDPYEGGRMAFRLAAEAGDARAAKVLGTMLDKGVEVQGEAPHAHAHPQLRERDEGSSSAGASPREGR